MMSIPSPSRGWILLVLIGLYPLAAEAQEVSSDPPAELTLTALLEAARAQHPALEAARLEAEALETRRAQVTAWPDPTAGLTVQPYPILTARGAQRSQWRLEQRIPFPGKRQLRGELADLEAAIAGQEAKALALELERDVRSAYYRLYGAQEKQQLLEAFSEQLRGFERVATTQYEVGTGAQQAILQAQLERGRLALQQEQLVEAEQSARLALARLTGREARTLQGRARLQEADLPDTTGHFEEALSQRPEAEALRLAREQAGRDIARAERDFYPDFTVHATYFDIAPREAPPTADGRDALAVGIGLQLPLSRHRLRASLDEARLRARQAEFRLEDFERTLQTHLEDVQTQLQHRQQRLRRIDETLIPQAESTREAALSAYTAGQSGFLDLLDAERMLLQLRLQRIDTMVGYLDAAAALHHATGRVANQ